MDRVDTIERTITVSSPIARVWEAITAAEHLSQWFGDSAEVDLQPGGALRFGWSEYDAFAEGVVEAVEHEKLFSYRWTAGKTDDGSIWTTNVTFTLDEQEGMTTITVVESGLSELPDELYAKTVKENTSGWEAELADLGHHLSTSAMSA
ncbi:MAG: ATPase [Acidimicrobiia bacterium]|nr:ATPase [Acidimicrobiia bacterium]